MFRCAKPFGQALRPEPAGVPPAAYGGSTAGGCTPDPREGMALRCNLNGQQRHPPLLLTSGEGVWGACPHVHALMRPVPRASSMRFSQP